MAKLRCSVCLAFAVVLSLCPRLIAQAPPTTNPGNAADLYRRAFKLIVVGSPMLSAEQFPQYPPFGLKWDNMAKAAFEQDASVRELARRARAIDDAAWPTEWNGLANDLTACRAVAYELADAAKYQHVHGDDAGAMESIRDILHMADMLRLHPTLSSHTRPVIAAAISALAADVTEIISSNVRLTPDANDARSLQVRKAAEMIAQFSDYRDATTELFGSGNQPSATDPNLGHEVASVTRNNAERTFAALSLACHLFQFDHHRWPTSLDELAPTYIQSNAVDPWGDGKQTFGYAIIKGGLPDGSDRPLLYDRCLSKDGLFYRTDIPTYGFSTDDSLKSPPAAQGGQFRDVTQWQPTASSRQVPTTRPLQ